MESAPAGEPAKPTKEKSPPSELIIPQHIIQAFGKGLMESFKPSMRKVSKGLPFIAQDPNVEKKSVDAMTEAAKDIGVFIEKLAKRKQTRIIYKKGEPNFDFSEENEEIPLKPGPLALDADLFPGFIEAFSHNLANYLSPFKNTDNIIIYGAKNKHAKSTEKHARSVNKASKKMTAIYEAIRYAHRAEMLVDEKGKVKITSPIT